MKANGTDKPSEFSQEVGAKEERKLKARRRGKPGVWYGLGMFGLIGWSVVVPAILGAMLGLSLDKHYPQRFSWTLTLLITGLAIGCFNAWYWVDKESKEIQKGLEENDE